MLDANWEQEVVNKDILLPNIWISLKTDMFEIVCFKHISNISFFLLGYRTIVFCLTQDAVYCVYQNNITRNN